MKNENIVSGRSLMGAESHPDIFSKIKSQPSKRVDISFKSFAKKLDSYLIPGEVNIIIGVSGTGKTSILDFLSNTTKTKFQFFDVQSDHSTEMFSNLMNSIKSSDGNIVIDGLFFPENNTAMILDSVRNQIIHKGCSALITVQSLYDISPENFTYANIFVISRPDPFEKGRTSLAFFNKGKFKEVQDYCDRLK